MDIVKEYRNESLSLVEAKMEIFENFNESLRNLNNINKNYSKVSTSNNEEIFNSIKENNEDTVICFEGNLVKDRPSDDSAVIKKELVELQEQQTQIFRVDGLDKTNEVQVKKEIDINPLEFCDVKMDINEESEDPAQQSYLSQKVHSGACRRKELSEAERRQIVDFHNAGEGYKKIASRLATNRSTVRNILMKWKRHHTVATLPRNGRKRKPKKHSLPGNGDVILRKVMAANGRFRRKSGELNPSSSFLNNPYDPKKMIRCPECNNLFTKNYIKVHVLNHSKEIFECSKCSYSTNRKERLELHELNHLETKTFQCQQCTYATNIQKYFKEHVKIHTDRKVFTCSKCDYQTNIKKYLREHVMIHTEKKLFKCSKCYYETNRKDRLRIHEQNHSEVKRFHCGHCDFGTNIKRVLKDHELTHLEATMFHCTQCEYTTNFKSSLNRHNRTHCKKKALGTG